MQLDKVRIVLVEPSHPGNIGATARAMKNMGLSQLCLVAPKKFPDQEAFSRASGADDILQRALVVPTLEEGLTQIHQVYATSARSRHLEWPLMQARNAAVQVFESSLSAAVVFGRENSGLTNAELALCDYHIQIPSAPHFSSLNLAQAVQVVVYELYMASLDGGGDNSSPEDKEERATFDNIEGFHQHLESTLTNIAYLNPQQPKMLMQRLRRLFRRAELLRTEVDILRGILSKVDRLAQASRDDVS